MSIILITGALLLANAFFVGAEFAAMAARRSQLEPLAAAGSKGAQRALDAGEQMASLLAMAQLGITVCSVLLGAYSEAALHHAFLPLVQAVGMPEAFADVAALVVALLIVVFLHVVVGEMIPKNMAIATPERSAILLVPALHLLTRVLRPFIRVMEHAAKAVVRAVGVEPKDEMSAEVTAAEMAHIVDESRREGLVEEDDYQRLGAALEFSDKVAGDVAVPIDQLITVAQGVTPEKIERLVAKRGFSRFPMTDAAGDLIGYLHLKDVLFADEAERTEPIPAKRIRRMTTVRPDDEIETVLVAMQGSGTHLARVVDGTGSTVGVVFLEDVLEELVGEVVDASQR